MTDVTAQAFREAAARPICDDTEQCCRELSRVWEALGVEYNGKSCSENVAALRLAAAEQREQVDAMQRRAEAAEADWQAGNAQIATLTAERDALTWQSIVTAPKDGTLVLVGWIGMTPSVGYFSDGQWWSDAQNYEWRPTPTHWLPIPELPNEV